MVIHLEKGLEIYTGATTRVRLGKAALILGGTRRLALLPEISLIPFRNMRRDVLHVRSSLSLFLSFSISVYLCLFLFLSFTATPPSGISFSTAGGVLPDLQLGKVYNNMYCFSAQSCSRALRVSLFAVDEDLRCYFILLLFCRVSEILFLVGHLG